MSGGKVLKIARNIKGIAQNQAEIEIWNKTKSPLITQIFNAATDFKWVVAEVVKEMKLREFLNSLNLPINFDFDEILLLKPSSLESIIKHLENKIQTCEDKILNLEENLRATQLQRNPDQNTIKSFEKDIQRNKENVVEIHQVLKNKHFLEFCENIIKLVNTQSLVWGELHYKHFGRNVQGKVKLFDYGYTESVSKQYYGKR